MKKLNLSLEHCYGIKKLDAQFDFTKAKAVAIYAPNGSMKSSLAKTFQDISRKEDSKDRIFPKRTSKRVVADESGKQLSDGDVLVVEPYDADVGHTEKTSTLLVDAKLRQEYDALQREIDASKDTFIKLVKAEARSKANMEREYAVTFAADPKRFDVAMGRIKTDLGKETPLEQALLQAVPYDLVFDEKVMDVLGKKDSQGAIKQYIENLNELLAKSSYFKRGVFNYYNAETIADQLAKNGFFEAKHSVNLNSNDRIEITTRKELEEVIAKERDQITGDAALRKKFDALKKLLEKNQTVRDFADYLSSNEGLLLRLDNVDSLRQDVLIAYARPHMDAYKELVDRQDKAEGRIAEIAKEAERQETLWERMIAQFNERFYVPFRLRAVNKTDVVSGKDRMLSLEFTFKDEEGNEEAQVERSDLLKVLSQGERKALYILNVLFEIEARKQAGQDTLLVVDDIADSFDYKNKYAIIQYLFEITRYPNFRQLILTHNFDFYRTIHSRQLVQYEDCYMASRTKTGLHLRKAEGFKNVFVNDWKKNFFKDPKKRIASIPFLRNLIEFSKGESEPDYIKLTSLLHWKADTPSITEADLDAIYERVCGSNGTAPNKAALVVDSIFNEAQGCISAAQGANFENKIVLSIAIRLLAEKYMQKEIADQQFVDSIKDKQTSTLLERFSTQHPGKTAQIRVIERVLLMTPENIHLNSFMYEPILDMSDDHLRTLYSEVASLA
jgi:energy-coupling factor transporter ATP-binding protein EcfA2